MVSFISAVNFYEKIRAAKKTDKPIVIVDVRPKHEMGEFQIKPHAALDIRYIVYSDNGIENISLPEGPVYFLCKGGVRSEKMIEARGKNPDYINIDGGWLALLNDVGAADLKEFCTGSALRFPMRAFRVIKNQLQKYVH